MDMMNDHLVDFINTILGGRVVNSTEIEQFQKRILADG